MGDWHHPPHYGERAKRLARRLRQATIAVFLEDVLPALRDTARNCGYALTVHGSLARDLDLVAVPWVEQAVDADALVKALAGACRDLTGWGVRSGDDWTGKPHGRRACTIVATSGIDLDLSVMPRLAPPPPPPPPADPESAT